MWVILCFVVGLFFTSLINPIFGLSLNRDYEDDLTTQASFNEIENYVNELEKQSLEEEKLGVNVDLPSELPDERLPDDIETGIETALGAVDDEQGETDSGKKRILPANRPHSRQLSLMYQGVYAPDQRFNAFVDGVMVNMVAEMRRKRMDPLYFRVYDRGIVEHVPTTGSRRSGKKGSNQRDVEEVTHRSLESIVKNEGPPARNARQRQSQSGVQSTTVSPNGPGTAIGGGVIRGLTNIKRFGNAEVQVAGNTTLVRSHYVFGPMNIELLFTTEKGVKTINSTLTAIAGHSLAQIHDNSLSRMLDFVIDSPARYEIYLTGHVKNERFRRISQSAILRLLRLDGRMERRLQRAIDRASQKQLKDVPSKGDFIQIRVPEERLRSTRRNRERNQRRNKGNGGEDTTNEGSEVVSSNVRNIQDDIPQ